MIEKRYKVERWLMVNQKLVNFASLERKIDCPKGVLQKFVKYDYKISENWIEKLDSLLKEITKFNEL